MPRDAEFPATNKRRGSGPKFRIPNSPFRSPRAFTLVEMLLALALTTVLITVTGRIAVQTLESQASFERLRQSSRRANLVFEQLATDVGRLLAGLPGETTPLTLFGTPRQVLQLSDLASTAEESGDLHSALRPATVRYRLSERTDAEGGWRLTREVVDRTALGAVTMRETIAEQVAEFKVEVFSSGAWVTGFAPKESNAPTPAAVRVSVRWNGETESQTRTFLVSDAC